VCAGEGADRARETTSTSTKPASGVAADAVVAEIDKEFTH
jgi:hypothetical protein